MTGIGPGADLHDHYDGERCERCGRGARARPARLPAIISPPGRRTGRASRSRASATATLTASGGVEGAATVRVLGRISYTAIVDTTVAFGYATFVMNADGTGVEQLDFLEETDHDIS